MRKTYMEVDSMINRKQIKKQLRENPQFAKWLKGKPDLYRKMKQDPSVFDGLMISWKKEQMKQNQWQKIGHGYRQIVSQIHELNTLINRVDQLMSNIKVMNEKWSEHKGQWISDETTSEAASKRGRKKKVAR